MRFFAKFRRFFLVFSDIKNDLFAFWTVGQTKTRGCFGKIPSQKSEALLIFVLLGFLSGCVRSVG